MTGEDKKGKPYQHDSETMEVVLRFLDRKQGAVNCEYWGECSSATLPQSVDLRGDKKENKLITSYDCQAITVSFKRKMYKKKMMHVQSGCFDCHSLDVAVAVAF